MIISKIIIEKVKSLRLLHETRHRVISYSETTKNYKHQINLNENKHEISSELIIAQNCGDLMSATAKQTTKKLWFVIIYKIINCEINLSRDKTQDTNAFPKYKSYTRL